MFCKMLIKEAWNHQPGARQDQSWSFLMIPDENSDLHHASLRFHPRLATFSCGMSYIVIKYVVVSLHCSILSSETGHREKQHLTIIFWI